MRPWLSHYDPGVAYSLSYPNNCVHDLLMEQAARNPDRIAVIYNELSVSYATIDRQSQILAGNLTQLKIRPGDRVGICLRNSIEFVVAFFGILKAGGVVAALNPGLTTKELDGQIAITGLEVVITDQNHLEKFVDTTGFTRLRELVVVGDQPAKDMGGIIHDYSEFVTAEIPQVILPEIKPSDAAVLQFSGGTTGTPKAALGSHQNLVANVTQFRNWLVNLEDGKETYLITIPLYHVYGQVLGLLLGIAAGATLVIVNNPRNVDEILEMLQNYPISYFPAVPTIFSMIVNHPDVAAGKLSLKSIKACISGSAPLGKVTQEKFEKYTGGYLVEGYGLSEAPTATHCNPILGEKRSGSIGLPLPDVDCRVVDLESHKETKMGDAGELLIYGPQIMMGYHEQDLETKLVLENGWLHTGDVVRMDAAGYFYVVGRIKDLIKVHGMQVWPSEVESVLGSFPGILECAVAGVPDDRTGERVKVWIVAANGATFELSDIQLHCREKLAEYKIPREMELCEHLPRSSVGKILRRELLRNHLERKKIQGA